MTKTTIAGEPKMSKITRQRRSGSSESQNSAPLTPTGAPRPLTRTPFSPPDLHPSLGREAEDGDGGSPREKGHAGAWQGLEGDVMAPALRQRTQQTVQEPSAEPPIPPELAQWIRLRSQDLKIRQKDRQWAVEIVNHLRDNLLNFLKNSDEQPYFQSAAVLSSGSYYEMVKIHNPNEFDIMIKLQPPSRLSWTELDQYHGLFYQIALSRPTRSSIRAFLLDDGLTISASKILSEMHRLVRKFISTYKVPGNGWRWVVNRKRPNSPAVTLALLEVNNRTEELLSLDLVPALEVPPAQAWPMAARSGLNVDNWLGKKARHKFTSQTFYFVPKKPAGRNLSEAAKESWRISFSHIEKEIIKFHGNKKTCCESAATKCCRKQCLKLLKCLIEGLKQRFPQELDALCSYHGKTAFLHTLSVRGQDSLWLPRQLPDCFMYLLGALEGHARSNLLPHFFVPSCNLFAPPAFPRKALVFLTKALEEQRKQRLPLLMPPALAPPMAIQTTSPPQALSSPSPQALPPPNPQALPSRAPMANFFGSVDNLTMLTIMVVFLIPFVVYFL